MNTSRIIPPSQLIINEDGSAFHIHLKPEQIPDNILLVGDPGRVDMVASFFDSIKFNVSSREFHAIGGKYKGTDILCLSHGIGADNIEIVITELDALVNINFKTREIRKEHRTLNLVRLGTSGALVDDLSIGDYVIAQKALGTDGILNFYAQRNDVCDLDFENKFCHHTDWDKSWAAPYIVDADQELVETIGQNDMRRGFTIAAVGFYAPQGREVRLKLKDPKLLNKIETFKYDGKPITNFEMESACLQGLSKLLGHRAMTVCCIIAQRKEENADTDYKHSVNKLVKIVLDRFSSIR